MLIANNADMSFNINITGSRLTFRMDVLCRDQTSNVPYSSPCIGSMSCPSGLPEVSIIAREPNMA